mgnify:FL=1
MQNNIPNKKLSLKHRIYMGRHNYILMAPFLLMFAVFTLLPVLVSIFLSFTYYNCLNVPRFTGWDNYLRLFLDDNIFLIAFKNTMIFALITGPISYMLCFFFAWLINDLNRHVRTVVTAVFYAPVLSGQAYSIWTFFFSSDSYGIINGTLMRLGLISEPIGWLTDPKYILTVIIVVQLWMSLGTGFLSFIAGLQGVDRSLYEAGVMDGVHNRLQEVWFITLPSMKPQLLFGAVMQIVSSFSVAQVSVSLVGSPSPQYAGETIVTHISDVGNTRFEMGYACAIATVLFLLMAFTNFLVKRVLSRVGS